MRRIPWGVIVILFIGGWVLLQALISLYPEYLWFEQLGYASVFWTNFRALLLTGAGFGLLALAVFGGNVLLALRLTRESRSRRRAPFSGEELKRAIEQLFGGAGDEGAGMENVTPDPGAERRLAWLWGVGTLAVALFLGLSAITQWEVVLKALNGTDFGLTDPVFNREVGFYVFSFPLLKFVQGYLFTCFLFSLGAAAFIYLTSRAASFFKGTASFDRGVKAHLLSLLAALVLLFAWGLRLGALEVLYSARGVVYGAGYTDVNAQLLGYDLQVVALFILAAIIVLNIFRTSFRLLLGGAAAYLVVALVMGGIYPSLVQNFQVKPSEISLEAPYIANGIKFTRLAYGLDKVEVKDFLADQKLSLNDLKKNELTVGNIRLWDPRPLLKSYRQIQAMRLYYDFTDVDVARYTIDGRYRQVMLSARELVIDRLPESAQTWVNRHLIFTHGYGVCLSPVNEQTPEGLPALFIKDIPPVSRPGLEISRPEIYYGEETNHYVLVNTTEQEFDYPKGDQNVYTSYQGKGGVVLSSFWRRLAFAIKFSDLNIMLTDYLTPDSRVLFDRNIHRRVRKVAPFLRYDRDPYLVIDQGRLFWVQDAYTVTNMFPYSDPTGGEFDRFNYIRNSVKVVIDAYNGDLSFYLIDQIDPLALAYQRIYPTLFKPFNSMPPGIREHLRYPEDLFLVQARKYAVFHMNTPQSFYNQEDLWNKPKEIYAGSEVQMVPYYVIMRLPREKKEEFLLMLPFTPNKKSNMIAWLAGRSDGDNYGKLIVYKFPKDKLVYGPMQIEARIDQQTEISQEFTLWSQAGSRVIRGNLLAIPIEQSIVYVEPIYLEAASGSLPELKRVIATDGQNVVMETSLDRALSAVFSGRVSSSRPAVQERPDQGPKALARQALQLYNNMQSSLRQGNFGGFGERLGELGKILQDLAK